MQVVAGDLNNVGFGQSFEYGGKITFVCVVTTLTVLVKLLRTSVTQASEKFGRGGLKTQFLT